jgi:glycosyltransferase involved in cell wall biosynthesis
MRVVLLTHVFPRAADDPLGAFLLHLIHGLGARVAVRVVAPHAAGLALQEEIEGVPVTRFRYAPDADETLAYTGRMHDMARGIGGKVAFAQFVRAYLRAGQEAVRGFRPDVVHAHWWLPGGLVGALISRRTAAPLVVTTHGTDVELLRKTRGATPLARFAFGQARAITCGSEYLRAQLVSLGVANAARVRVIPMPVSTAFVEGETDGRRQTADRRRQTAAGGRQEAGSGQPSAVGGRPSAFRILTVARLSPQKGIDTLLDAVGLVHARGHAVRLTIIGDGDQRAPLQAKAQEMGLAPLVTFTGMLPQSELPGRYAECDVFVLPSVREGMGLVLAEALLCGAPIIATASGGVTDIVRDGETGLLFPERDASALAAAIERYVREPSYAARLAARGRAWVLDRFAPERVGDQFLHVYESVVSRQSSVVR